MDITFLIISQSSFGKNSQKYLTNASTLNVVGQFSRLEFKSDAIIFYVESDPLYRPGTFFETF